MLWRSLIWWRKPCSENSTCKICSWYNDFKYPYLLIAGDRYTIFINSSLPFSFLGLYIILRILFRNTLVKPFTLGQGRIKLFGAPRQWKKFRPLFQAVFLSGGVLLSPRLSQTPHKYFILYIEFVAADLLFRLARMRHAWKGDGYLTVLVFHGRYFFTLLSVLLCL